MTKVRIKGQTTIFDFLAVTYMIEYIEKKAQRLTWLKAMDEEEATHRFNNIHKEGIVSKIWISDRSYEELEALD